MNSYLNLETDDMEITKIISTYKKQLKSSTPNKDFKRIIIELDNIRNGDLSEYDDDLICDVYNNIKRKCSSQITHYLNDKTNVNGQTFGDLMYFLLTNEDSN